MFAVISLVDCIAGKVKILEKQKGGASPSGKKIRVKMSAVLSLAERITEKLTTLEKQKGRVVPGVCDERIQVKISAVNSLAEGLAHNLAILEKQKGRGAPGVCDEQIQVKMSAVNSLAEGLVDNLSRLEKQNGGAEVFDANVHGKMYAMRSLAAGLVDNLTILEKQKGENVPGQQRFEHSSTVRELQTKHQQMTSDLMLKYQEVTRAHDSQAARAKEMENSNVRLQQQVELLTQQKNALQENLQSLARQVPVASATCNASEGELHEALRALRQARGEVQQWQEQHQQAHGNAQMLKAQYENTMLELQQSQLVGQQASALHQQAVEEADKHRQELLLMKESETMQVTTLKTKVMELESLVAEKQREVDSLSHQLRGTRAEKVGLEKTRAVRVEPEKEILGGAILGSVIEEIAALKKKVNHSPSKSSSVTVPVRAMISSIESTGYPMHAPRAATSSKALTVEQGNLTPPQPLQSRVLYKNPATSTQAKESPPKKYLQAALPALQASTSYKQVSRPVPGAVGINEEISKSYRTLAPRTNTR